MNATNLVIIAAGDSTSRASVDTMVISNWPDAFSQTPPNIWITTVLPVLASAALALLAAYLMYAKQKRDTNRDQLLVAFNLFHAVCDEMQRARARVWNIIEHSGNKKHLKGPFVLDARQSILGRLAEVMPPDWEPRVVFRFYELVMLVAHHHNRATQIPFVSPVDVVHQNLNNRRQRVPQDETLGSDMRSGEDARHYALGFSLYYYDRGEEDSLTSLYIDALKELNKLARKVDRHIPERLSLPTDEERQQQRAKINTMMAKEDAPTMPYGDLYKK